MVPGAFRGAFGERPEARTSLWAAVSTAAVPGPRLRQKDREACETPLQRPTLPRPVSASWFYSNFCKRLSTQGWNSARFGVCFISLPPHSAVRGPRRRPPVPVRAGRSPSARSEELTEGNLVLAVPVNAWSLHTR